MSDFNHTDHSTTNHSQTPRYRRPKFPWFKTVIVALIAGIIGALLVLGIGKVLNSTILNKDGSTVQTTNNKGGNQLDGQSKKFGTVHEMIKSVSPTIVGVINMQKASSVDDLLKANHLNHLKLGRFRCYLSNKQQFSLYRYKQSCY